MNNDKIRVRVTSSGQTFDGRRNPQRPLSSDSGPERLGLCSATPWGREIVYERSREEVKTDLVRAAGFHDFKR